MTYQSAEEFRATYFKKEYLFDPTNFGRIFCLIDFANVRKWAKGFWPKENKDRLIKEIDIAKLHEVVNCVSPVEKLFYYGFYKMNRPDLGIKDPANQQYRDSIFRLDKASKAGFRVRRKEVKKIIHVDEDGTIKEISKCNFDVEMTMEMILNMEKFDTILLWSGDSDFYKLLLYLVSKGKKIIVVCGREFASTELNSHEFKFIPADPLKDHLEYTKVPYKTHNPAVKPGVE